MTSKHGVDFGASGDLCTADEAVKLDLAKSVVLPEVLMELIET